MTANPETARDATRPRILHVIGTPRAEGTPNLVLDWLGVPDAPPQEVYSMDPNPADLTADLRARAAWYGEGGPIIERRGVGKYPRLVWRLITVCRRRRSAVLVCWPTGFALWICLGARLALGGRVRLLVHAGNPPTRGPGQDRLSRFLLCPLGWLGARVVCCSQYVQRAFEAIPGVSGTRFTTVYNCTRLAPVSPASVEARRRGRTERRAPLCAIMVATLEGHKDQATLLRALPSLLTRLPGEAAFRLRLVGDGTRRAALESLARELGPAVTAAVEFLGTRRDVPALLDDADVFVFSTTPQEGLGSALLEALAVGLPVVATDVPACRELLQDGRRGVLVPSADPEALAGALRRVCLRARPEFRDAGASAEEELVPDAQVDGEGDRDLYLARFTPAAMLCSYLEIAHGVRPLPAPFAGGPLPPA